MSKQNHWNKMYKLPLDKIPWEISQPPRELVKILKEFKIKKGDALDVACGTGNYSIYLAIKGFNVTGIDFSKKALVIAKQNAKRSKVKVRFLHENALKLFDTLHESFDFILDYSLLHHIEPKSIESYAKQFIKLLNKNGKLLLVCYSEKDSYAELKSSARGKYGNLMYYRTKEEIRKLYKGLEEILYKEVKLGKRLHHKGHCFLFTK